MLEPRALREPTATAVEAEGVTAGMAAAAGSAVPAGAGMAEKKKAGNGRKGRKGKGPGKKPGPPEEGEAPGSTTAVPLKLKEMKNQEAAVGQKLVLRCETTSEYPALRFKWLKNGKEITKKNRPENIKIPKKQKKYSELHIYRATLADAGEYVCRVSSKLGNDSTKASVIITDTNESTSKIPVSTEVTKTSSQPMLRIQVSTEGTNTSSSTSTSTTGTSHLTKCDIKQKAFCVNGGECYMVKDLPNPPRYLCRCQPGFTGARCTETLPMKIQNQEKAEELYQKRVLTITGICIALLVVGIMCVVAYCKTKKQRKKLHDRLRQSLRSERNNVMNMANGPHHPNPPPDNVQLVNQYVSKNVISGEHVIERETETSFSTSHYTSTTHHSVTVTQTPSHRYVSAMTTPARMSPVDFHTPTSPKSRPSTMSPPASSLTISIPSVAVSPFIEEERPLLLVTPLQLHEKYDHHLQQFNSFHHNATHESNSLPPSPLRIVEDEEYETTQEYEPAQEPPKKLTNSRRVKRTKPNGHISSRVEVDSDTSSESSSSETETEDERIGEDTPFLSIPNPGATGLEPATAFRLAETRTNPANRFSTPEELQARLSSVIANQDPIAV
ncbi:pro-neuregulin-1, membrane-bound isoform isoform X7 [Haemorhous mexicanus]|uniref:pro-neuregulin-1, membrane-bound isoform isoform X7 n=1 Tax=Haemorhous mexicanus TaxID=30427 RepID=UPI0028BDD3B2|nr:pro-neuregulin-1, membrane-bound isoform isoform X7 [Haemorhous mexicanus]